MLGENCRPSAHQAMHHDPSRTGTVVAQCPLLDTTSAWDPAARRMTILALDSGQWSFAWVHGWHHVVPGLRVAFREHPGGARFPTFFPLTPTPGR